MTIITNAQSSAVESLVKQAQADKSREKNDEQATTASSEGASASNPQDTVELSVGAKLTMTIQSIKDSVGYDPTTAAKIDAQVQADADFSSRFKDLAKAVFAAAEEAAKSIKQPTPFAVIKDAEGKQVGRLFQDGGLEVSDNSYAGLITLVEGVNGKKDRYDALKAGAKGGLSVELTGVDVEPTPIDRTKIDAALKALHSYVDKYQSQISG